MPLSFPLAARDRPQAEDTPIQKPQTVSTT
jgi:hypothetical protein